MVRFFISARFIFVVVDVVDDVSEGAFSRGTISSRSGASSGAGETPRPRGGDEEGLRMGVLLLKKGE